MRRLRVLYAWPAFYATLVVLGVAELVWSVTAWATAFVLPETTGRRIGRLFVSRLYRTCFWWTSRLGLLHVDATALDALDPRQPMIIAPNHPSVLDALILISRLENLNCIMKASVLDNPLLGGGAKLAGYIRNDGPKRMLRLSSEDLRRGGQLIVFPEGTRTIAAPVNPFKHGFAAMARIAQVPVQTVFIETDTPFMGKGWSVLKVPPRFPMHFRVRVGRRFEVGRDVDTFVDDLQRYFVNELADAQLGELWGPASVDRGDACERPHPPAATGLALADTNRATFGAGARGLQR